jgi:membrane fusion protein (multidrug efflux system)
VLQAKEETDAIAIARGLLQPNNQVFTVRDSILDIIDVKPVYFSDKEVVVKGVPNGTKLVSKPVPGAYAGMLVKIYQEKDSSQAPAE